MSLSLTENSNDKPWLHPVKPLTADSYQSALEDWQKNYCSIFSFEQLGESAEHLPIYLLKITDPDVADEAKYTVLLTALHSGSERSGTAGLLHSIEWLLGDSSQAISARKSHIILVMPIGNPGGYFLRNGTEGMMNSERIDIYTGIEYPRGGTARSHWNVGERSFIDLKRAPEIAAFMAVVDEYLPEVHFDMHGVTLDYAGQIVQPSLGSAGSNYSLRPWDWRFLNDMILKMNKQGQSCYLMECDSERLFAGEPMLPQQELFWSGKALFYTAMYAYLKCHTFLLTAEVPWNEYALTAVQSLLELGAERGYPVDTIKSVYGGFCVKARGATPGARRNSRSELWLNQAQLAVGFLYPCTDRRELFICAVNKKGLTVIDESTVGGKQDAEINIDRVLDLVERNKLMPTAAIREFVAEGPTQQKKIALNPAGKSDLTVMFKQGLALEFRIYHREISLNSLYLNGTSILNDVRVSRQARDGGLIFNIDVPPENIPEHGVFIITCSYTPSVSRSYGWSALRK